MAGRLQTSQKKSNSFENKLELERTSPEVDTIGYIFL